MMGIIALAGIVVNNGVVLLDYTQILIDRKKVILGISDDELLTREEVTDTIIKGGKARLRPVILTAITTVLGLIPLATGLNINFITLFGRFDPQVYVGGDNVIFWGPLAWTVIFGLIVATFLTLIIVPVLFNIVYRLKLRIKGSYRKSTSFKISSFQKNHLPALTPFSYLPDTIFLPSALYINHCPCNLPFNR